MEELQARHRKELKDLLGKITSKKKNATKKTRKGVNDECDRLEAELKERQQNEVEALAPATLEEDISNLGGDDTGTGASKPDKFDDVEITSVKAEIGTIVTPRNGLAANDQTNSKKPNRQKARLARRAAEQEAQVEAAAKEAANMPNQRQQELAAMKEQMKKRGLVEIMIRPDGHCLYSACAHTLPSATAKDYKDIRVAAADYMSAHPDEFSPFMVEPMNTYTEKIKNTAEWGGHLELQAIAKAFKINVHVLQASGQVEDIQPDAPSDEELWLAYYRHSFGLGEHYNALKRAAAG